MLETEVGKEINKIYDVLIEHSKHLTTLTEYINEFLVPELLQARLDSTDDATFKKHYTYWFNKRLKEHEGCLKGFIQKYYDDGHPHSDKKTNKDYY